MKVLNLKIRIEFQGPSLAQNGVKTISLSMLSLTIIVGGTIFVLLIMTFTIVYVIYLNCRQRRRMRPMKTDVPEEYITYRHFELPSAEYGYS